ncbi:MAG TPA: RNA polymerase sigma factor [Saprospiraceae bacterium]|nr:RNA polymerase sigma factor [Saprospiraceae bacterium]
MNQTEEKKKRFSGVVLIHFSAVKRFAFSLCRSNFDADDLVSETFMKAFENFNRVRDESKIKQWLFRILNNQFISNYRHRKRIAEIESIPGEDMQDDVDGFSLFEAIAKSDFVEKGNPEKQFISNLTQIQIDKAINELPGEFRDALVLCDIEEFTYAEISLILQVPIGTVRSRISRARSLLQKKLWLQALEHGIISSRKTRLKPEYTCTCGKDETKIHQSGKEAVL